ncbi:tRNA (guanosine(37)-N1)-methyltransferase TrmD [Candidatus Saccharibacteria bacterium]|nr:tRNA (guanosine(37)-N1)-methyltransferase TrmD [Candidatus Saccharibacteria bacterium]
MIIFMIHFQVITLFPEMFAGVFGNSMLWKAQEHDIVKFSVVNLRNFGLGPRKTVDDTPYGGGDGMLLKPEPIFAAVEYAKQKAPKSRVLLMTPRGVDYSQKDAERFAKAKQDLILICGRYEGYDERITSIVDEQICIGHYVLTGGEIAAMTVVDSVVRLLPGVLGGEYSAQVESFTDGDNREYPQYTRPEEFNGMKVPQVLLSGNHAEIEKWRQQHSLNK